MTPPRIGEAGYSLVALLASVTIMLVLMAAAVPSWRYVMKNDAEEELLFRGGEIADAIARYQQRNGNALPPSFEVLVKGRFLRKAYKDPMTRSGEWRLIRQGEGVGPIRPPTAPGAATLPGSVRSPTARRPASSPAARSRSPRPGATLGGIQGVASTSEETSLRVFNGRTKYSEWLFLPGQPRVVGRPQRRPGPPGAPGAVPTGPGGRPATSPPASRR